MGNESEEGREEKREEGEMKLGKVRGETRCK